MTLGRPTPREGDDAWVREALRLLERYQVEVVESFGLCPWAGSSRRSGHVDARVVLAVGAEAQEASLEAIAEWTGDEVVEVALLVYPRLEISPGEFDDFTARLRSADAERHVLGGVPFAMAAFHPHAPADVSDAELLIPFLRRTPDPTVQLVRAAALERVRASAPQGTQYVDVETLEVELMGGASVSLPLRERIARANLATVARIGVAEIEQRLDEIREDRRATYGRLTPRAVC
jgi:hypothetical protein